MASLQQSTNRKEKPLHILIVGGSIAALTLANCLHVLNIGFTVLESHSELAPDVGASIVLFPSGARILQQLGIWDDMSVVAEPIVKSVTWMHGKKVSDTNAVLLARARHGQPLAALKRSDLLRILAEHVVDKERVKTNKRVFKVEHSADGVVAYCADGSEYRGDIIVGADGIRSVVRKHMQGHIESISPGKAMKDLKAVSATYSCIFGLSGPLDGIATPRVSQRTYSQGRSLLSFVGSDETLYWFLFSKLDRTYIEEKIPKYSKEDAVETAESFFDLTHDGERTFKDVWVKRTMVHMVAMEEAQFENWTSERYVCIGDAAHKMTANLGGGGNCAIESAAALANAISVLPRDSPSLDAISTTLHQFFQQRHARANAICDISNDMSRKEAPASKLTLNFVRFMFNIIDDLVIEKTCSAIVGGELLDFLPSPDIDKLATMPFNQDAGAGKSENRWSRVLWALPLLGMLYGCHLTMGVSIMRLSMTRSATSMNLGHGMETGLWTRYFGLAGLDKIIGLYVAFFTPGIGGFDKVGRLQMIAFLADIVPVQIVWMIEANRRGNRLTVASLMPTLIAQLYQIKGIGFLAPLFYFLHYVQSPLERYAAADSRMVNMGKAKIIIWTVLISYIIPTVAMFVAPALAARQWINGLFFQPFPLWAKLIQYILSKFVNDTTNTDKISKPEADMPHLRRAYAFAAICSAATYFYVYIAAWEGPVSVLDVFFKDISKVHDMAPIFDGAAKVLRYDHLWSMGSGLFWVLLNFGDLKKYGKVQVGWVKIFAVSVLTTALAGPGTAIAIMWWWREEALACNKRSDEGSLMGWWDGKALAVKHESKMLKDE